jgi:heterodisulfide reductase subunit A
MAVAKSGLLSPLQQTLLPVNQSALVVGGGIAGMTSALGLAQQGFAVALVEESDRLGGHAAKLNRTADGEKVSEYLSSLIRQVTADRRITVCLKSTVANVEGFVGNFTTDIATASASHTIAHGIAILATGAQEHRPREYLYGEHAAVVTHLEMDAMFRKNDARIHQAADIVFIQCVGSREDQHPYCSKVCCTHSIQSALTIKETNPAANVYILYRDIRTYGRREELYRKARKKGVIFFRYSADEKPQVTAAGKQVRVEFKDRILNCRLAVDADLLCLATAIVAHDNTRLSRLFKVPVDADGWLLEAHQKLRPVDVATDGLFLCGMAHYPKPIEESIIQARAAASRAVTCLAMDSIRVGGIVSKIDPKLCSGCKGCLNVCPFGAITFCDEEQIAEVNPALCKGCGACAAACPSEAPLVMGFTNNQLYAQIKNAFAG